MSNIERCLGGNCAQDRKIKLLEEAQRITLDAAGILLFTNAETRSINHIRQRYFIEICQQLNWLFEHLNVGRLLHALRHIRVTLLFGCMRNGSVRRRTVRALCCTARLRARYLNQSA